MLADLRTSCPRHRSARSRRARPRKSLLRSHNKNRRQGQFRIEVRRPRQALRATRATLLTRRRRQPPSKSSTVVDVKEGEHRSTNSVAKNPPPGHRSGRRTDPQRRVGRALRETHHFLPTSGATAGSPSSALLLPTACSPNPQSARQSPILGHPKTRKDFCRNRPPVVLTCTTRFRTHSLTIS